MVNFDFTKTPLSMVKGKREYSSFKTVISIVTPTYNPSSLILETKDCILNQTYPYFEWIIVDDGSTNKESLRILDKLSKEDDRIKVLHKKNEGLSKTRDYGVKHSSKDTQLVVFIDDDDYLNLTYLECAYVAMLTHKDAGWCYSDVVNFGGIESLWNKQFSCRRLKNENILVSQAMVRKKAFYDVDGFMLEGNGHYEDWIFWLKLLAKGYSPIHMGFYGFWYRRKSNSGQHNLAKTNHKRNMKEIAFYASKVEKDILPIEYPKDDYNWDGINDSIPDVVIPKFKKNGKKNILVIVPWMTLGGADKFNLDLFKMMDKEKFSVTLLSMQPTEYAWRLKFEEACDEVFDLSTFLDRKDWLAFVNYIIESRGIDVIFNTNSVTGYMMLPYLSVKYKDIPILDYIHMEEWYNRNGGYSRDSASVSSVIDKTLFCNKNSERIMNEYFKVDKKKLGTVYIGVDENKFYPDKYDKNELLEKYNIHPSSFVIGLVARIDYQKRPFLLMRIIEETVKSGKIENVLFLIAGDGPLLKDIKKIAKNKKLEDYVKFLGKTDSPDQIYAVSDMTINCSIKEGLALTAYESLAMGCPVLSCDVGGQKELIDSSCGLIVPCLQEEKDIHNYDYTDFEIQNYVDGIVKIYKDNSKYKKNARKRVLNGFTIDNMVKRMEEEFSSLKRNHDEPGLDVYKELINEYFVADKGLYSWLCKEYNEKVYGDDLVPVGGLKTIYFKLLRFGEKIHLREEVNITLVYGYKFILALKDFTLSFLKLPYYLIKYFVVLICYICKRIWKRLKKGI